MSKKTIWTIVIIIVVIILGIWLLTASNDSDIDVDQDGNENQDTNGLQVEENAVVALDQKPGNEVVISDVVLADDGYVVIHEVDEDGAPGEILSASGLLEAGEYEDVIVEMDDELGDETELIAMLHNDDGDGVFDAEADVPVESQIGGPIMMSFMIDTAAGENFDTKL